MILLRDVNPESKKLLIRISNDSKCRQVRERAKCIILFEQGFSLVQLRQIFWVSEKTIYNWLMKWERLGLVGLYNQKGRGRKPKLSTEEKEQVRLWVKSEPRNLKKIVALIQQEWGKEVNKETVKRIIKKYRMLWKRMKRGLSKSPASWELEVKIPRLVELKSQDEKGEIDLRYLDESGFSLMPSIPYGWQEKGTTITLKSSQSKRINVLGLMNKRNELHYQIYQEKIDSKALIKFLDEFSETLAKPTVIIMEQASIHTSDILLKKLEDWEQKNLKIFWLPPYSPKYNLIEILWKFIKYKWIEVTAYKDWSSLLKYLKKVLDNFGKDYVINFV